MSQVIADLLGHADFPEGRGWRRRRYPAGSIIVREGEYSRDVYLIEQGTVRVLGTVQLPDDRNVRPGYSDLGVGTVFGELTLFGEEPRSATVEAVEDSTLVAIDGCELIAFMERHPSIGYRVLVEFFSTLAKRLRIANKRVASLLAWGLRQHGIDEDL